MASEKNSLHCFAHQSMGTTFEGWITGCEITYARQAAQAFFSEIDRLERLFSRFNPSSEISLISRLKPGESMRIGAETYECLAIAEKIRQETAGAFDINFRSVHKLTPEAGEKNLRLVLSASDGFSVTLEREKFEPGQACSGIDLDLGGIGKGYALDRAVDILADWEIDCFLFHAGTSTALARGDAPGSNPGEEGWPVGAGAGLGFHGTQRRLFLQNRALSGSGVERKGGHIIDPRRGCPADQYLAVWVSHPQAAEADALSTAFMAMRQEEIRDYCRLHQEVWALVLGLDHASHVFNQEIFV